MFETPTKKLRHHEGVEVEQVEYELITLNSAELNYDSVEGD